MPAPLPVATGAGANTAQDPVSPGLVDLNLSTTGSGPEMNSSQDEWITGFDMMQTYDFNTDLDLETGFLTMADDLNAMSSGDLGAFDPLR